MSDDFVGVSSSVVIVSGAGSVGRLGAAPRSAPGHFRRRRRKKRPEALSQCLGPLQVHEEPEILFIYSVLWPVVSLVSVAET